MSTTIPAELLAVFPDAELINFEDIQRGDTVASCKHGRFIVGIADRFIPSPTHIVEGAAWESPEGSDVAYDDEEILLIHRPKPKLPTHPQAIIRLDEPVVGSPEAALLWARSAVNADFWVAVGYQGVWRNGCVFDNIGWTQVFLAEGGSTNES